MYAGLQVRCQQNLAGARPGELLLCILEEDPFLGLEIAASASGVLGSAGPLPPGPRLRAWHSILSSAFFSSRRSCSRTTAQHKANSETTPCMSGCRQSTTSPPQTAAEWPNAPRQWHAAVPVKVKVFKKNLNFYEIQCLPPGFQTSQLITNHRSCPLT